MSFVRTGTAVLRQYRPYGNAPPPTPDFTNTAEAFKTKTTKEILRSYLVYKMFTFEGIVSRSQKLIKVSRTLLGQTLFNKVMRATIYGQFVGGEDVAELKPTISRLKASGVHPILDYAVEEDIPEKEVVMEIRQKDTPLNPTYGDTHPQFKPTNSPGDFVVRSSARTYFYKDEEKCDQNMEHFLHCINCAADASEGTDAFAAVKVTGLGRTEFLLRLSEVVVGSKDLFSKLAGSDDVTTAQITPASFYAGLHTMGFQVSESTSERLFKELDQSKLGRVSWFNWSSNFQPSLEIHKMFRTTKGSKGRFLLATLDEEEQRQMRSMVARAETLAECASNRGVRMMIDAEQTYFQPAIHHLTVHTLMPKYNSKKPIVYNTIQAYLKDSGSALRQDFATSDVMGFSYGMKLVRGAYMEQERYHASQKGYPDPIFGTKGGTDENYERLLVALLQRVQSGRTHIMVATHNEQSVQMAINRMKELGINPADGTVVFAQLLGMRDHISFPWVKPAIVFTSTCRMVQ
eukprot:Em0015g290a